MKWVAKQNNEHRKLYDVCERMECILGYDAATGFITKFELNYLVVFDYVPCERGPPQYTDNQIIRTHM